MSERGARILVSADSAILEANDAALDLLAMSFEQLRALPPGALSLEEEKAATAGFVEAWRASGGGPIVGSGTVRLLDSRLVRVRYLITPQPDGTFEILLERGPEPPGAAPRIYRVGDVLSAWRAAERRLAAVARDSPEWAAVSAEIEYFRAEYQRLARARAHANDRELAGGAP